MEAMPYDLCVTGMSSKHYYQHIIQFTDDIIRVAKSQLNSLLYDYTEDRKQVISQKISIEEAILDLITVGVLFKEYHLVSYQMNKKLRNRMIKQTKRIHKKEYVKWRTLLECQQGILLHFAMNHLNRKKKFSLANKPSISIQLQELVLTLTSFDDFNQEVVVLQRWIHFFQSRKMQCEVLWNKINTYTTWFLKECEIQLGCYTKNVRSFCQEKQAYYRWRADSIFCMKSPAIYHFNMVGAELMGRYTLQAYKTSTTKQIILPTCMCKSNHCPALEKESDKCFGCTKDCQVNLITKLGEKYEYHVRLASHESNAFSEVHSCGIIGVSCVTRLLEGGWKAISLGMAPQCILLDCSGCKNHWNPKGMVTSLNMEELKKKMI